MHGQQNIKKVVKQTDNIGNNKLSEPPIIDELLKQWPTFYKTLGFIYVFRKSPMDSILTYSMMHANGLCPYLLTPWFRVLLEKLTGLQLVKKFPAFLWNPKVS